MAMNDWKACEKALLLEPPYQHVESILKPLEDVSVKESEPAQLSLHDNTGARILPIKYNRRNLCDHYPTLENFAHYA